MYVPRTRCIKVEVEKEGEEDIEEEEEEEERKEVSGRRIKGRRRGIAFGSDRTKTPTSPNIQ